MDNIIDLKNHCEQTILSIICLQEYIYTNAHIIKQIILVRKKKIYLASLIKEKGTWNEKGYEQY